MGNMDTYQQDYERVKSNIEARTLQRSQPDSSPPATVASAPATMPAKYEPYRYSHHHKLAERELFNDYDEKASSDLVAVDQPPTPSSGTSLAYQTDTYKKNYERVRSNIKARKLRRNQSNSSPPATVASAPATMPAKYEPYRYSHHHKLAERELFNDYDEKASSDSVAIDSPTTRWVQHTANSLNSQYSVSPSTKTDATYQYLPTSPDAFIDSTPSHEFTSKFTGGSLHHRPSNQQHSRRPFPPLLITKPGTPGSDLNPSRETATERASLWDSILPNQIHMGVGTVIAQLLIRGTRMLSMFQHIRPNKRAVWIIAIGILYHSGHRIPIIGGILSLLKWCLTIIISLGVRILLHAAFRARGGDPDPMICYSHEVPQVYPHIITYHKLLTAHGFDLDWKWDQRLFTGSKLPPTTSPSAFSRNPTIATLPVLARRDLIDVYESLLVCMRSVMMRTKIDPIITSAATELHSKLSGSRHSLINGTTDLSNEFTAIVDQAAAAIETLHFLRPYCRLGCLILRLDFPRFWECAQHSVGVQFFGRWRMAVCEQRSNITTTDSNICINNPWGNIVHLLECILDAWRKGSRLLKATDYTLLNMIPHLDSMLLPMNLDLVALLEETAESDAVGTKPMNVIHETQESESGRHVQVNQHSQIKKTEDEITTDHVVSSGKAALKIMGRHIRRLVSDRCSQLCSSYSDLSEISFHDLRTDPQASLNAHDITDPPLSKVCAELYPFAPFLSSSHIASGPASESHHTRDEGISALQWVLDARKLLIYARKAQQNQAWNGYSSIAAWKVDGREILDALAEVKVLATVANVWVRTEWAV